MGEKTLTEMLADVGIRHQKSSIDGKRDLYDAMGNHIGCFDAKEALEWLRNSEEDWPSHGRRPVRM